MAQQQPRDHLAEPIASGRSASHVIEKGWTVYDAVERPIGNVSEIDTDRDTMVVDGRPSGFGTFEVPLITVGSSGGNEVRLTKVVEAPAPTTGDIPRLVDPPPPPSGTASTRARARSRTEPAASAPATSAPVTATTPTPTSNASPTNQGPVSDVNELSPPYAAPEPVMQGGQQTPDWGDGDSGGWSMKKMALAGLAFGGLATAAYVMRRRARRKTPFERFMDLASEYLGTASDYASDYAGVASDFAGTASEFARDRHPAWWASLAAAALPIAYYAWPTSKPTYQEQARGRTDDLASMLESYLQTFGAWKPSLPGSSQELSDRVRRMSSWMPSTSDLEMPSGWSVPRPWADQRSWSMPSDWPIKPEVALPVGVLAASALTFFLMRRATSRSRSDTRVSQVMTRQPRVIQPDATVVDAAAMMRRLDVGSLPVCDGTRLIGMVTDRDITTRSTADGRDPHLTPVRDVMSHEVAWASEDDPVEQAAQIMRDHRIRRLPIVDDRHSLVGMVSLGDLATDLDDDRLSGDTLEHVSEPNHRQ